ncbi:hypothetical protein J7E83_19755 [Arthrobacter sp. ISL-48]|uniref:hypothetical protein n=1 Tax=Arthrobacter sp. ISL-48 TaxID=2819110 RepID=UPI001BE7C146|nr:hypothetical protein [Arthrobacter sp. ISL-48]MBT2534322.1 hypothetical protein [Arthrobacter sp. ISL-48]
MSEQNHDGFLSLQRGDTVMKTEETFRAESLLGDVIAPAGTPFGPVATRNKNEMHERPRLW